MARGARSKRSNGDGSVFQDKKGFWWAQVTLPDGRQPRRRAKTEREAREKLKQLLAELERGVNLGAKQPTVSEWCKTWLAEFSPHLKPTIRKDYEAEIRRYIDAVPIGKRRLDQLTPADVQRWVNQAAQQVSAKTVKNVYARLHRALEVAVRQSYISRNVADYVELPQHRAPEIKPLDFTQAVALLSALASHRLIALYRLALNLGMRQSELTGLTWDVIDFKAKTIAVRQQLQRLEGAWSLETTKTKAGERILAFDTDLDALLVEHRHNQAEEKLLLGPTWRDPFGARGGLVFTSETGAPLHGSMVIDPFKQALKRADLPNIRFHDLRHTAATLMLADKVPLVTVSKVLGHSSPAITAAIYAHALDESKASAIAGLSARLRDTSR